MEEKNDTLALTILIVGIVFFGMYIKNKNLS